ncbi:MAG: hypothetical protein ABEJ06_02435 [Haloarculaceae archaeon]
MTSTVVGKVLEAGLVVLYIGLVTTALFGGVVPGYRATAGDAVADRTLATAAERIQQAVPSAGRSVSVDHRLALPGTIAGAAYRIEAHDRTLYLVHPNPAIDGRTRLALSPAVVSVRGRWESGASTRIVVERVPDGLAVRLVER